MNEGNGQKIFSEEISGQEGNDMSDMRALLISGAKTLGVHLSEAQTASLFVYLVELKKWNRKINLTAIRKDRDIIIKHFLDSFSFMIGFPGVQNLKLLDMGAGAGFPALPLKIAYPQIMVTMVESVGKKASFLRHMTRTLQLRDTEVLEDRSENLGPGYRSIFDVVTARALTDMQGVIAAGLPFLKPGGRLIMSRGAEETINEADWKDKKFSLQKKQQLVLPHSDYRRVIWVFKKAV